MDHFNHCFHNNIKDIHEYSCWCGFTEIACPLTVHNNVAGMLVSGQIVPINFSETTVNQIRNKIDLLEDLTIEDKSKLKLCFEEVCRNSRTEKLINDVKDDLNKIKKSIQPIINVLAENNLENTINILIRDSIHFLNISQSRTHTEWWNNVNILLNDFCTIFNFFDFYIYTREESRYKLMTSRYGGQNQNRTSHLVAKLVINGINHGALTLMNPHSPKYKKILENLIRPEFPDTLEPNKRSVFIAFRYDTDFHENIYSTVIILKLNNSLNRAIRSHIVKYCENVSKALALGGLIYRLQDSQNEYKTNVGIVAHSFRTPLQYLLWDIEELRKLEIINNNAELFMQTGDTLNKLIEAREDLAFLLDNLRQNKEKIELIELLSGIIEGFKPIAARHPCTLTQVGKWPSKVIVHGYRFSLRICFQNIIDNAIKYSFSKRIQHPPNIPDWQLYLKSLLYDVRISFELLDNSLAKISISNYGIGIPQDMIELLKEGTPGFRAMIKDNRRERTGTGWGIPTAIEVLKVHGGWLNLESKRNDSTNNDKDESYLRYKTTATIFIPIIPIE
jgi:signal transduction histidine kinase